MKNDISIAEIVVGNASIKFEMPTSLYNVISTYAETDKELKLYSYNVDTLLDIIRPMIPEEHRPPTHKQEHYARSISEALNLELSKEILENALLCSEFIGENAKEYRSLIALQKAHLIKNKGFISQASKVNRWLGAKEAITSGKPIELVAEELGVKPPTIEKYIRQYEEWEVMAKLDDAYITVMGLVKRARDGEDIYEDYHKYKTALDELLYN